MELTSNLIISNINNYFNAVLKNHFNFPETYSVSFDENRQRITLTSDISDAKLPTLLQGKDNKWRIKIEQALLKGFKNIDNNFQNVNIYILKTNEILITYTYGENPMTQREIGILSKLAAEYETENIDRICTINRNFAIACKNELFWWSILRNKYPEYYKSKRELIYKDYDALEVLRGMDQYVLHVIPSLKGIEAYTDYNARSGDLKVLIKNYPETFRYLIIEGFWQLRILDVNWMLNSGVINDLDVIKVLINTSLELNKSISVMSLSELYMKYINNEKFELLREIDNYLNSINIILPAQFYVGLLETIPNINISIYDWIIERLNTQMTSNDYLSHFNLIRPDKVTLYNYILSKININDFTEKEIVDALHTLSMSGWHMSHNFFNKFEKFYEKVSHRLSREDKMNLYFTISDSSINNYTVKKYSDLLTR